MPIPSSHPRTALVVSHPGHELRVHGWLERTKPVVHVLTDGSGHTGSSRLDSTTRLLELVGARAGSIYGRYSDESLYALLRRGAFDEFFELAQDLAAAFVSDGIEVVAGDAIEGYNPGHDVCRFLVDTAVALARRRFGHRIRNLEFLLVGPPDACPDDLRDAATWVRLDDLALDRKVAAALAYEELREEVANLLKQFGRDAFRVECLRPPTTADALVSCEEMPPFYETHGRERVREGHYDEPLTWREHLQPVHEELVTRVLR